MSTPTTQHTPVVSVPPNAGLAGAGAGSLQDRYADVKKRIGAAAKRSGRSGESIVLIAVTKTAEPDQIRDLIKLGHADFGENRVQQLVQRAAVIDEWMGRHKTLPGVQWQRPIGDVDPFSAAAQKGGSGVPPQVRWHMIGHLQRNKARKAVETCRLIHSIDSLRLAEELQLIAVKRDTPIEVLMQVNCSGEEQKYGCAPAAAVHLAEQMETMVHVQLRGIMTMAAHTDKPQDARPTFGRCRELFEEVRDSGVVGPRFNILSMGMSGDYEAAIEEGSNMVRVGSAIFGPGRPGAEDGSDEEDDD